MDISPLWISLEVALIAVVITFFLGVFAAWVVTGMKRYRSVIDSVLSLPLVLPPTVTGFLLLIFFGKNTGIGSFLTRIGIDVVFTQKGAVIAAITAAFPIMYRTARGAFEQIDPELIDAARAFGCGRAGIVFQIAIPLSWSGLASGIVLTFARALGEFGATIMIAGNIPGKTQTMSVAVYTAMQSGNRERAFTWVAIIVVMSSVTLFLINFFTARGYKTD